MIKISGLNKTYRQKNSVLQVLNDLNFTVAKGEIFGVIGKSGAGKSTLLKCLNLLERPDSGEVIVDGVDLMQISPPQLREARQRIGVIFQGFNLLNSKTVFANVALPLVLHGKLTSEEIANKVNNLLDLVELTQFANLYPASLSGGQKQRVGIARALATDPKVLLSDEATSALDPQITNSILNLLLAINKKLGLTIVLITHEIEVVQKLCDKVAVIDGGEIVEMGNVVDIILHPKHELTRKLILEEESTKYLEQISDFYKFDKTENNSLLMMSFIGNGTFDPVLSRITKQTNVQFSVLRGQVGRIKRTPFGQILVEATGSEDQLQQALAILNELNINYEIIG